MHIFVTGGAGYIGSICSEELINAGHQVTIFDNLTEGHRKALDSRAKFIEGDLANREQIIKAVGAEKPDAIMHFAANALVGESMTNPSKYFRNNVAAGVNLLDAAVEGGVKKFIFSSTCATYGTPEKVPMDERLPQKPINPYGESKLMFEKILNWYDKIHGLVYVNLRYFNAAGASEKFGEDHRIETHLIPNIIKVALGQRERAEIQPRQRRRILGQAGRRHRAQGHRPSDSGGGQGAAPRRSATARGQLAQDHERTRLAPEISTPPADHRKRLGVAPEVPERVWGLS
jgi:UDP-glucose 4-epimerase